MSREVEALVESARASLPIALSKKGPLRRELNGLIYLDFYPTPNPDRRNPHTKRVQEAHNSALLASAPEPGTIPRVAEESRATAYAEPRLQITQRTDISDAQKVTLLDLLKVQVERRKAEKVVEARRARKARADKFAKRAKAAAKRAGRAEGEAGSPHVRASSPLASPVVGY